jgi:hypothetical protein
MNSMTVFVGAVIGMVMITFVGIIISGGTFGQRCSNYTDSAYQECLIRLSNGGEP